MNLESLKYRNLKDYLTFYDYVSERIPEVGKTYLIFDELQNVMHWEKAVESFRLDYDVDIYITGSNAYLLSAEFSTLLSGRYVEIRMLPLSFKEFLTFYKFEPDVTAEAKFQKYLQFGGMPVLHEYRMNEARSNQALEGIYSTVVLRDILQRNPAADQATLHKIVLFLCSNIGSINSPNSIGNVLSDERDIQKKKGKNIAGKTVHRYISMLNSAFVFYPVSRYDVKGKQFLKTLGKVGETEIDFVAEKPDDRLYIQVTESMQVPETRERELRPLCAISDNYEKIVLSMDQSYINTYDGIKALNLIDWLLE